MSTPVSIGDEKTKSKRPKGKRQLPGNPLYSLLISLALCRAKLSTAMPRRRLFYVSRLTFVLCLSFDDVVDMVSQYILIDIVKRGPLLDKTLV